MSKSYARATLEKACFFAELANQCGISKRKAFESYFEAAIVFARSVTFHIQKEYKHQPDFDSWYSTQQDLMKADPLLKFFNKERTFILKEGPIQANIVISASVKIDVSSESYARLSVVRNKPWYRRNIRIIFADLQGVMMEPILKQRRHVKNCVKRIRAKWKNWTKQQLIEKATTKDFYFDDPSWSDRPALELLGEYLNKLKPIVDDAEARFGDKS